MNILYVIEKQTGDEIAIFNALRVQGHNTVIIKDGFLGEEPKMDYDFVLFNHSSKLDELNALPFPKVFWYFDLADHSELPERWVRERTAWFEKAASISDLGFCTDGKMAARYDNVYRLVQGAQTIYVGKERDDFKCEILFAGLVFNQSRFDLMNTINEKFPAKLKIRTHKERVFGIKFAHQMASTKIVIAPDSPIHETYWSNRVFMVSGYKGFILHPYIEDLNNYYRDGEEIVMYKSREDLYDKIDYYLSHDEEREQIASKALARTSMTNMYSNRVRFLVTRVEKHLRSETGV